jgi:DNA polymerase
MANAKGSKVKPFRKFSQQASECRLCPRMADQPAVLTHTNGSLDADILFVAEAPGRFGAGRTGIPFHGDRSGENFETLLSHIKLTRKDVFITNAVLCNPLQNGNNAKPSKKEIRNCSHFLESVLNLIRPKVVVTLGAVGLDAMNDLLDTKYVLNETAAKPQKQADFILLPLYHPSPRVTNTRRPLSQQKKDFQKILSLIKRLGNIM